MKNVILGTSSYRGTEWGNRVSISGDHGASDNFRGSAYPLLAPKRATYDTYHEKIEALKLLRADGLDLKTYLRWRAEIEDEYIKSYYETRLKNLDIEGLFKDLERKFGSKIILLCYESMLDFCHRRLVADYITLETGLVIPEIQTLPSHKVKVLTPIDYKERLKRLMR